MLIAICDDESLQRRIIRERFRELNLDGDFILKEFVNGRDLINSYANGEKYNIIILDIKMQGFNGIETAKKIREIDGDAVIIFLTGSSDYAIDGYEVNAFDYMLKPITKEAFSKVIAKAVKQAEKNMKITVMLRTGQGDLKKVETNNIVFIESFGRKIIFHLVSSEKVECSMTMADIEIKFTDIGFLRVHKSYIVNLLHVNEVSKTDVVMNDGTKIPISRRRQKYIYDIFTQYLVGC